MTNYTSLQLQSVVLLKLIVWYHFTSYPTHIMILLLILRIPSATLFNRDKSPHTKKWLTLPSATNFTILILQSWTIISNPTKRQTHTHIKRQTNTQTHWPTDTHTESPTHTYTNTLTHIETNSNETNMHNNKREKNLPVGCFFSLAW